MIIESRSHFFFSCTKVQSIDPQSAHIAAIVRELKPKQYITKTKLPNTDFNPIRLVWIKSISKNSHHLFLNELWNKILIVPSCIYINKNWPRLNFSSKGFYPSIKCNCLSSVCYIGRSLMVASDVVSTTNYIYVSFHLLTNLTLNIEQNESQ